MEVNLNINERKFVFDLDFDPKNPADISLWTMIHKGSVPEKEVLSLMFFALAPGDIAVDVGANVGLFTIFMKQLVGSDGTVLAFEPSEFNYKKLFKNLVTNELWVEIHKTALSDRYGSADWYETTEDTGQSSLAPLQDGMQPLYQVATGRLDDFLIYSTPKLIKIDCEGAEEKVLRGAKNMLARGVPFIVCELTDITLRRFGTDQFKLRNYMGEFGYDTWLLRPDGLLPVYVPPKIFIESDLLNINVLFASSNTVAALWGSVHAQKYLGVTDA